MADQITEAMTMFTSLRENLGCDGDQYAVGAPITFPGTDYASKTAYEVGEGATDSTEDTLAFSANEIPTHECITPLYYPISGRCSTMRRIRSRRCCNG